MVVAAKDERFIVKLEQAIAEKYGRETIQNFRAGWNENKQDDYLRQVAAFTAKHSHLRERRLFIRKDRVHCPICDLSLSTAKDDVCHLKFGCCFSCYIEHVEHREKSWEDKRKRLLFVKEKAEDAKQGKIPST